MDEKLMEQIAKGLSGASFTGVTEFHRQVKDITTKRLLSELNDRKNNISNNHAACKEIEDFLNAEKLG